MYGVSLPNKIHRYYKPVLLWFCRGCCVLDFILSIPQCHTLQPHFLRELLLGGSISGGSKFYFPPSVHRRSSAACMEVFHLKLLLLHALVASACTNTFNGATRRFSHRSAQSQCLFFFFTALWTVKEHCLILKLTLIPNKMSYQPLIWMTSILETENIRWWVKVGKRIWERLRSFTVYILDMLIDCLLNPKYNSDYPKTGHTLL